MAPRKEVSISIVSFLVLAFLAVGLGFFYRLPSLDRRPMHADEAILGMKLADYWQDGHFEYDPKDYHGPALHQVTSTWGKFTAWGDPSSWTDGDLRLVVALCGMGVMLSALLFAGPLGRLGTALAMLMTAVSPMMVYFSRYFIMEMQLTLLIMLTLGCFWRFSQSGGRLWLILGGMALGFAHATKETFIINVGAALAGWIVARVIIGDFQPRKSNSLSLSSSRSKKGVSAPWLWVLAPALLVSVASYSGGFRDWQAVQDSFFTFGHYFERSEGSGHEKPWHYYLTLLIYQKDGLVWSEAMIVALGLVGMIYALVGEFKNTARQALLVFLSVYTLALIGVYSLLSYKTPWCILSAQHSLTLLAGAGAGWLWTIFTGRISHLLFTVAISSGLWFSCWQTKFVNDEYRADQRNPYAYSHTTTDLLRLVNEVKTIAADRGESFSAQVINRDSGWPLPWYWRTLTKIGYQMEVPSQLTSPVIIVEAEQLTQLKTALGDRAASYSESGPYGLRPGVYLTLLVQKVTAPEPQPVAPVIQPAAPAPESTAPIAPPAGTLNAAPTLTLSGPGLPVLPGMPMPLPGTQP
jgi:uncharacterized protein (TIGR03663 family)